MTGIALTDHDESPRHGEEGPAAALAMRLVGALGASEVHGTAVPIVATAAWGQFDDRQRVTIQAASPGSPAGIAWAG